MRYTRLRAQLRRVRRQHSLTQAALAARSGTSRVTIAHFEAGSGRDVRMDTVARLCEALGPEVAAMPRGTPPRRPTGARGGPTLAAGEESLANARLGTEVSVNAAGPLVVAPV